MLVAETAIKQWVETIKRSDNLYKLHCAGVNYIIKDMTVIQISPCFQISGDIYSINEKNIVEEMTQDIKKLVIV